jgi:hypothetical protein
MFVNTSPRYEILSEDAMATLDQGWRRIVSELGIEFMSPWALELLREAGQKVEGDNVNLVGPDADPAELDLEAVDVLRQQALGKRKARRQRGGEIAKKGRITRGFAIGRVEEQLLYAVFGGDADEQCPVGHDDERPWQRNHAVEGEARRVGERRVVERLDTEYPPVRSKLVTKSSPRLAKSAHASSRQALRTCGFELR